jgi:hypothetical protein
MSLRPDLCVVVLLVDLTFPAEAHDIYSHLQDRSGNSCCDNKDCRPAPYRVKATGVQMFVGGNWISVHDYAIQYRALPGDTGETGGGHWCGRIRNRHGDDMDHETHCAVLPPYPTAIPERSFALGEGRIQPVPQTTVRQDASGPSHGEVSGAGRHPTLAVPDRSSEARNGGLGRPPCLEAPPLAVGGGHDRGRQFFGFSRTGNLMPNWSRYVAYLDGS